MSERKRSETAWIQVIQEAFVQGVSTRKAEDAKRLAAQLSDPYRIRFPKAVQILEDGLVDSLVYPSLRFRTSMYARQT